MPSRLVSWAACAAACCGCSLDAIGAFEASTGEGATTSAANTTSSVGAGAGGDGGSMGLGGAGGASVSSAGGSEPVVGAGGAGGGTCDDHVLEVGPGDGLSLPASDSQYCQGDEHFSFGAWIRPLVHQGVVLAWLDTAGNKGIQLTLTEQGVVADVMTSATKCQATAGTIPLGAWTFVSVTRVDDTVVLRVDAPLIMPPAIAVCTGTLDLPRQPPVRIAKGFEGQLDDVYIVCNAQSDSFDPSASNAFNSAQLHFGFEGDVPWANDANDDEASELGMPAYPCQAP
jgi:hypothetical protein